MILEQLCMLEETFKESMMKQMKQAFKKGIVPGAMVCFDKDINDVYKVINLHCNNENKLAMLLINKSGNSMMSWPVLSDRVSVVL